MGEKNEAKLHTQQFGTVLKIQMRILISAHIDLCVVLVLKVVVVDVVVAVVADCASARAQFDSLRRNERLAANGKRQTC